MLQLLPKNGDPEVVPHSPSLTGAELAQQRRVKALAVLVNSQPQDLAATLPDNAQISFITRESPEGLHILRHDAAHIMAQAVHELFPDTEITIGPVIENGFFYDFLPKTPFSEEHFPLIEERMRSIVERNLPIVREVWSRDRAVQFFLKHGQSFKAEIIRDIPEDEPVSVYKQGDWLDLCRGPHLPSTGALGTAFKLLRVSGSYWRGDHRNPMLQRIYGTAWDHPKRLREHIHSLEEAKKRDHRKLARSMRLVHFHDDAPGAAFWLPNGRRLVLLLEDYMRTRQQRADYHEINTPDMLDRRLWERSGHWDKFSQHMFSVSSHDEQRDFALKPMNCPGHVHVFNTETRSYRQLPLRFSEFGKVHRFEPSGALHGLLRARHFTQDDAHIFCTHEQIQEECVSLTHFILSIYSDFGFNDVRIKFADRPPQRIGDDSLWDRAENALRAAADASSVPWEHNPGEGAFYGPKLEFVLRDAIGRDWQCGTVQIDFNLPERLDASYIAPSGDKERPAMIHRALFGSLERFTGLLLEHYAGLLPLWLAPVQCVVASVTDDSAAYAKSAAETLQNHGLRAGADLRNEKISYKIREHSVAKVPIVAVVGAKEVENSSLNLRRGKKQEEVPLQQAVIDILNDAKPPHHT